MSNNFQIGFTRKITPEDVTVLPQQYIFVFGSNLAGIHGKGAAKDAWCYFGAEWGFGEGLTGRCYALPTKDQHIKRRPLARIGQSIELFLGVAKVYRNNQFYVTKVGCGLAQYRPDQIAPLFYVNGEPPENVWLPEIFTKYKTQEPYIDFGI